MSSALPDIRFSIAFSFSVDFNAKICTQGKGVCVMKTMLSMTRMSSALPDTSLSSANGARICIQGKGVEVMSTLLSLAQMSSALPENGFSIASKASIGTQASVSIRERKVNSSRQCCCFY